MTWRSIPEHPTLLAEGNGGTTYGMGKMVVNQRFDADIRRHFCHKEYNRFSKKQHHLQWKNESLEQFNANLVELADLVDFISTHRWKNIPQDNSTNMAISEAFEIKNSVALEEDN